MITFENLRTLGRPIAYFPKLAKPLGGVNPCLLFSQLMYWHDKTDNELGVYKTVAEIENETGLTEREQKTACEKLEKLGILTKTYQRLAHRMYYKLHPDVFNRLMIDFFSENGAVGEVTNPQLAKQQKRNSRTDKCAVGEVTNPQLDEPTNARLDKGTLDYQENTNKDYVICDGVEHPTATNKVLIDEMAVTADQVKNVEVLDAVETTPTADDKDKKIRSNPHNVATWNAYAKAYRNRYGILPESNAKTRGQVAQFVKYVGAEKAPLLAEYFVQHNNSWFVQKRHDFGALLQNYQQVATDFAIGQQSTRQAATQAEKTQTNFDTMQAVLAARKARRENQQGN